MFSCFLYYTKNTFFREVGNPSFHQPLYDTKRNHEKVHSMRPVYALQRELIQPASVIPFEFPTKPQRENYYESVLGIGKIYSARIKPSFIQVMKTSTSWKSKVIFFMASLRDADNISWGWMEKVPFHTWDGGYWRLSSLSPFHVTVVTTMLCMWISYSFFPHNHWFFSWHKHCL